MQLQSPDFRQAWLDALLSPPPPPRAQIKCIQQQWSYLRNGQSIHGSLFFLKGQTFAHGLGTHANSEIEITLDVPARRLQAVAGVDDNPGSRKGVPEVVFSVEVEGELVWESAALTWADAPALLDIPLAGARRFTLKATASNAWPIFAHCDWADLRVTFEDGTETILGESVESRRVPRKPVFSLRYGGRELAELLHERRSSVETQEFPGYTLHSITYTLPDERLACILEVKKFADHPAVEWLLRLRNVGASDTAVIEEIQALDIEWPAFGLTQLHRSRGSQGGIADFAYQIDAVEPGAEIAMVSGVGRSSENWLPFFNLQTEDYGVVAAIGWSGQWAARVSRSEDAVSVQAGLERTHSVLHPGEEIRTPRVALVFWQGQPLGGNNLLRRLLLDQYTPRAEDGTPLQAPFASGIWGGMKTEDDLATISFVKRHEFGFDTFWIDAGWYGTAESWSPREITGKWYGQAGNWTPNPVAHPDGFRAVGDAAHAAGMRFLLWLEPERAVWGTSLTEQHPDWFLGERARGQNVLLNLGHDEARRWATEFVSSMIEEWGVDIYRQDFNFEPLDYWRGADTHDRQGMTEIRHIEGLYAFWDELRRRHPRLIIDNCASGGRRLDLELISRSIPLWRSDYQCHADFDPLGAQNQTAGLSYWLPLSGTAVGLREGDTYNFRSALCAALGFTALPSELLDAPVAYDMHWRRARTAEYKRARPFYYGDYHPLTRFSTERDTWFAYQMHHPDLNAGFALAFRREDCAYSAADFSLSGLDASREYRLEDADTGETWVRSGEELARGGLRLALPETRGSRLIFYEMAQ